MGFPPPLLLTRDPDLLDELTRLCAGAGVRPDVRGDPVTALGAWSGAPLVVVGDDLLDEVAVLAPPRRGRVVVVCRSTGPATFELALAVGASSVAELPTGQAHLGDLLADVEEEPVQGRVVGIVGGAGGAGASTLACALGQVAGRAAPSLVVDTDRAGPGLDRLLGVEDLPGVRWADLTHSAGRLGARALRDAVPRRDDVGVLTWSAGAAEGPPLEVLRDVVAAGQRGHHLVVLDLARQPGPVTAELVARCDQVLVLAPATISGIASTLRLVEPIREAAHLQLAVRRGSVPAVDVAAATGMPLVLEVPEQRGLGEAVDLGLGPVRHRRSPLGRALASYLARAA